MTRKLVTIKTITDIQPIPDADAIEVATVDHGWKVVVKKEDNYQIGQKVVYFEVDSWVPHHIAPFLSKGREPREYNGIKGERLRTIKLRGQISQGLILPIDIVIGYIDRALDGDFSQVLNIQKWEAPIPAQLGGKVKGLFPSYIPKTDEERAQNLYTEIFEEHHDEYYEVTEKLEGTSMTVYKYKDEVGVCGRNWDLVEDYSNSLWEAARKCGLIEFLRDQCTRNIAIQGELIGEGIQGNYYKIKGRQFNVFNVYDIDAGSYLTPIVRQNFISDLPISLYHVPILSMRYRFKDFDIDSMDKLLEIAEGRSEFNFTVEREGIVFKSMSGSGFHFKVISNKYLLK